MEELTPEIILKKLRDNIKDGWETALDDIHLYNNQKECACKKRNGETTNWTCNNCGKIVNL